MEKKEILADWLGKTNEKWWHLNKLDWEPDYIDLHQAWEKFRDLKFDTTSEKIIHNDFRIVISDRIVRGTLPEAFEELVKGVIWYNSIKEK